MTTNDPFDHPAAREWAREVITNLVPMIQDSAASVSLVPTGESDVKFAVELGLSIMLDKPIILAVRPGQTLPDHLVRVADEIVELDFTSTDTPSRIMAAVERVTRSAQEKP